MSFLDRHFASSRKLRILRETDYLPPPPPPLGDSSPSPVFRARDRQPGAAPPVPRRTCSWSLATLLCVLTALGSAWLGYHFAALPAAPPASHAPAEPPAFNSARASALSADLQAQLDQAYEALRAQDYDAARAQLTALVAQRPDWGGLTLSLARLAFYQHDARTAQSLITRARPTAPSPPRTAISFMA